MAKFKLVAVNSIRGELTKLVAAKRDLTISALFHSVINSNVAFASDMRKEDAADFDVVLRVLLPIKFNKETGKYEYSQKKAFSSALKLGIDLETMRTDYKLADKAGRTEVLDAFYDACTAFYNDKEQEAKGNSLDADAMRLSALQRVKNGIKKAKENGAKDADIVDILIAQGVDVRAVLDMTKEVA